MLLFVYGPYMNPKYLLEKGIKIDGSEKAVLNDYEICFSTLTNNYKKAMVDIKKTEGSKVEGVLYVINDSTLNTFDALEMVSSKKHDRIEVDLDTDANKTKRVYTFISPVKEGDFTPSSEYLNLIIEGALLHNLSGNYIEMLKNFKKASG